MTEIQRSLATEWAIFEAYTRDERLSKVRIRQRRFLFYAGAVSGFSLIMDAINSGESYEDLQVKLQHLAEELAHFAKNASVLE